MKFCKYPFFSMYISPTEVWPCPWAHYNIGTFDGEQDLKDMWHSDAAERMRQTVLDGTYAFCRKTSCPICERDDFLEVPAEEVEKLAVPSDVPEEIRIANDRTCNIACTTCRTSMFCPSEEYREKVDRALQKILPYANQTKRVILNGNGEFLANPSFVRFLKMLRPQRADFNLTLESNGILFDEAHWAEFSHLGEFGLNLNVTLNSLKRETYRYLSGGFDHLDRVLKNLQFLSELRRANKINLLKVIMVVQECNFQEIPELVHTLLHSETYSIDQITLRPVYKWFGMDEETYWFKNILNPLHPYHKEYLRVLEDDCWKEEKVYDWGCHNLREARPHPLTQEKTYNRLLLDIYENDQGLSAVDYVKHCIDGRQLGRIGVFGDNEVSKAILRLLKKAGAEIAFQLTWFKDEDGDIPKVSMQNFRPEMADAMLLLDFYDRQNLTNNLRSLNFQGQILTVEELIKGSVQ